MADLLDKVKQGIDKGVTVVSVRSKELIEITRLKNQIGGLEEQMKKSLPELGEAVYRMYLQDGLNLDDIKAQCDAIVAMETQIREKKDELKQTRQKAQEALGKIFCANCEAELAEHAKYCSECGWKAEGKAGAETSPGASQEAETIH